MGVTWVLLCRRGRLFGSKILFQWGGCTRSEWIDRWPMLPNNNLCLVLFSWMTRRQDHFFLWPFCWYVRMTMWVVVLFAFSRLCHRYACLCFDLGCLEIIVICFFLRPSGFLVENLQFFSIWLCCHVTARLWHLMLRRWRSWWHWLHIPSIAFGWLPLLILPNRLCCRLCLNSTLLRWSLHSSRATLHALGPHYV